MSKPTIKPFMPLGIRLSIDTLRHSAPGLSALAVLAICLASSLMAQLPEGPGKEATTRVCSDCHEIQRAIAPRLDRDGWKAEINKMVNMGANASEQDFALILDYLAANYPAGSLPRLNVNKAAAIDFETRLSLKRSEAAAVIEYRTKHGPFKSIEDLKKVPGVDAAKIEIKKDVLAF